MSVIGLNAVVTDCIMSVESLFLDGSNYDDVETVQLKDGAGLDSITLRSLNRSSKPQKSARRLKELLLFTADNVLQDCFEKLWMYIRDSHQSKHEEFAETPVDSRGTPTERMNNAERNYTLCL